MKTSTMKIAYLGKIQLSDVDLSYLNAAQQHSDITYILEITPRYMKGPAFNIDKICDKTGVFKAVDIYPEFAKYADFIDIDKFYVVNTSGRLWHIKAFWTNFLLLLFLLRKGFDLIHVVWPLNIYEFVLYFLKRKMVLTVHDPFPHTGLDTFIVRLRRKFAFKLIPRFIILNTAQRQQFIDFYKIENERVIDSKLSCYTYLKTIRPDVSKLPEESEYILFAGKISKYKGLDYLLPAMERVHVIFPTLKLLIAGSGNVHFDLAKYKGLDYIEFRNRFVPDDELVALIQHSKFLVCPYTDATQSGVIMSAFAFAKPVVATNVGGLPEMLGNNKYGMIVNSKDVDCLADGITALLKDEDMLNRFSKNIAIDYSDGDKSWLCISRHLQKAILKR